MGDDSEEIVEQDALGDEAPLAGAQNGVGGEVVHDLEKAGPHEDGLVGPDANTALGAWKFELEGKVDR